MCNIELSHTIRASWPSMQIYYQYVKVLITHAFMLTSKLPLWFFKAIFYNCSGNPDLKVLDLTPPARASHPYNLRRATSKLPIDLEPVSFAPFLYRNCLFLNHYIYENCHSTNVF